MGTHGFLCSRRTGACQSVGYPYRMATSLDIFLRWRGGGQLLPPHILACSPGWRTLLDDPDDPRFPDKTERGLKLAQRNKWGKNLVQGLRMKGVGEDLFPIPVVPGGHLAPQIRGASSNPTRFPSSSNRLFIPCVTPEIWSFPLSATGEVGYAFAYRA